MRKKGVIKMVEFWAIRIEYDLERIGEVPAKLQDKVRTFIQEATQKE